MPLVSKADLDSLVGYSYKTADTISRAQFAQSDSKSRYDIFLSHSYLDKKTVLQLNDFLETQLGLDVFVDWIENPDMNRDNVSPATAAKLRSAMDRSESLLYAVSANSASSKWMPWELGYSDALHGRVVVLPISDYKSTTTAYSGQEFVGLYPYITMEPQEGDPLMKQQFWVRSQSNVNRYANLRNWVRDGQLYNH